MTYRELPIVVVNDSVVFPGMVTPLVIDDHNSIMSLRHHSEKNEKFEIFLTNVCHNQPEDTKDIYEIGCMCTVENINPKNDHVLVILKAVSKAKLEDVKSSEHGFGIAIISLIDPQMPRPSEMPLLVIAKDIIKELLMRRFGKLNDGIERILEKDLKPIELSSIMASLNVASSEFLQMVLTSSDVNGLKLFIGYIKDLMSVKHKSDVSRTDIREDVADLFEKSRKLELNIEASKELERCFQRMSRMNPESSEYNTLRMYCETMVDLPWGKKTIDNTDIIKVKEVLDSEHFGLDKVKERIMEYVAVKVHNPEYNKAIICLVGPPGVGKTTIVRSIAKSLNKNYARVSLGGVRDEADVRGHRRTYVGSMTGKIIQALRQSGADNSLILLDELDKMGADSNRGDPASAFLELLDPEQNGSFKDHYLNVPYDLSKVMFVATANYLDKIPYTLRDRLEIIQLTGYTEEEKITIFNKHVWSKELKECGLLNKPLRITGKAVKSIIRNYTRESGVRSLSKCASRILRKCAYKFAVNDSELEINDKNLSDFLGPKQFVYDTNVKSQIGVVNGLAWTELGGELLKIQVRTIPGSGKITITGNLGTVMKESVDTAFSYIRSSTKKLKINNDIFKTCDFHFHFPESATPKDGPSAGIAISLALYSALTGRKVNHKLAMTGEISLMGEVLPIGGLKDKIHGAIKNNVEKVIIPFANSKDLQDVPDEYLSKVKLCKVKTFDQLLKHI